MRFMRLDPREDLRRILECYWIVEDDDPAPLKQKIIPDGFTEIIFHFGDPYRINLETRWSIQARSLVAGQIKQHFYLENSGASSIMGIKLQPYSLTLLFDLDMHECTDRVLNLRTALNGRMNALDQQLRSCKTESERIELLNQYFTEKLALIKPEQMPIEVAVARIFERKGMITVSELSSELNASERTLEKSFRKYVGLSPKFFARIIRFNYIFQLIKDKSPDWADIVYRAGYYDQSHFIRNFKAFTGEDPSSYLFEEKSLANFFLKKG